MQNKRLIAECLSAKLGRHKLYYMHILKMNWWFLELSRKTVCNLFIIQISHHKNYTRCSQKYRKFHLMIQKQIFQSVSSAVRPRLIV